MGQGTIVLSRARGGYRDMFRPYLVLIDDIEIGRIKRGQTLRFDVPAGAHRLQLKIDWCTSAPLIAEVEAGQAISFVCAPGGSPVGAIAAVTAGADEYISLRHTQN